LTRGGTCGETLRVALLSHISNSKNKKIASAHAFIVSTYVWLKQIGGCELKKALLLSTALMLAIVLVPGTFLVGAGRNVQQTATTTTSTSTTTTAANCSTYQSNLLVDYVNSTPHMVVVGNTIVTTFHVIYPDGTPVTLSPETASFNWTGPSGWKEFSNVPVIYNGTPGFYNYTQAFTQDIIQATGSGTITIYVVFCSCSDSLANRGPTGNTSSDQTIIPYDLSQVVPPTPTTTTTTTQVTPPPQFPTTLAISIIIIILLLLALLLFVLRRRRRNP
jgi:hypothetical protein